MKRLQVLLSFLLFVIVCFGNTCRVDTLLSYLYDKGNSDYVMIFAHRGDWRNAPETSLQGFKNCIDRKLDGIEVDVQMTKDSVLVIMHDATLDRTTTGNGNVSDFTLKELKELYLRSPIGVVTRQRIPTLEEVLILAKDKILIQVDKWQPYADQILKLVNKHNCGRQIVFRSSISSDVYKKRYGDKFNNIIYIPVLVCKGSEDNARLNDFFSNFDTPVMSFSFSSEDFPVLNRIEEMIHSGYRIWLNSLWATFNAGHDDETAIIDPDNSYGWLLRKGANIIFSDNPFLLDSYLRQLNRR